VVNRAKVVSATACNKNRVRTKSIFQFRTSNLVVPLLYLIWIFQNPSQQLTPEEKALAYLSVEVPRWLKENQCYSCHNNGDGARALFAARQLGFTVSESALADTTLWISRPNDWDNNKGDPVVSDKKLARIQFATSLAAAIGAGLVPGETLIRAAESLLPYQEADGSWAVMVDAGLGTPATYGPVLATSSVRQTLAQADPARFALAIERADGWLVQARHEAIMEAAAIVMGLKGSKNPPAEAKIRQAVDHILHSPSSDGGWGPYPNVPPEAFDTAMALLALQPYRDETLVADAIRRGRAFLISLQYADGGWPETTRPPGSVSYAQHISTTGWAALALLRTR
jgi:hypothetical protein